MPLSSLFFRAAIVPVISFGENDIYDQVRGGKLLRNLQDRVRNVTGISPVLIRGRGLFQYSFGLLPFRHSVTTVGKCSQVGPKVPFPSFLATISNNFPF